MSCCGTRQPLRLTKQACVLPTAATRSAPFFRPRRRSHRSPSLWCVVPYTFLGRVKTLPYRCVPKPSPPGEGGTKCRMRCCASAQSTGETVRYITPLRGYTSSVSCADSFPSRGSLLRSCKFFTHALRRGGVSPPGMRDGKPVPYGGERTMVLVGEGLDPPLQMRYKAFSSRGSL